MCLQPQISQPKLGQIVHIGGVLKTSGPADFKSVPGFENWPRFVGIIEQNKICKSLCQYCKCLVKCEYLLPPTFKFSISSLRCCGSKFTHFFYFSLPLSIVLLFPSVYDQTPTCPWWEENDWKDPTGLTTSAWQWWTCQLSACWRGGERGPSWWRTWWDIRTHQDSRLTVPPLQPNYRWQLSPWLQA